MEVVEVSDAAEFRHLTEDFLVRNEAANCLILGVSAGARDRPDYFDQYRSWVVDEGGEIVGAAVQTPPNNLILAHGPNEGGYQSLRAVITDVPGAIGARPGIEIFIAGRPTRSAMDQGVFQLDEVERPTPGTGESRPATDAETELLLSWFFAFVDETNLGDRDDSQLRRALGRRLDPTDPAAGLWVYEYKGMPVAMSGYGGPTPNGIRIGPVFTPAKFRRRGFATELVADQSQWLLDQGYRFCFLFTDLSNPASNSIYQKIGYRQVAESMDVLFA